MSIIKKSAIRGLSYLMPNYSGQIPFIITGSSGPFITGKTQQTAPTEARVCFNAGYSSATIGYNPNWVQAIAANAHEKMLPMHVSRAYPYPELDALAEKLSTLTDPTIHNPRFGQVQLCPCLGGSDAVEAALKIALKHGYEKGIPDGNQEIIFLKDPFHGRSRTVIGTGKDVAMHEGFSAQNQNFKECPINDTQTLKQLINKNTAGVIVEPVQGEPGIYEVSTDFARALRESCNSVNALLIADEVQTGFYRTGRHCFASSLIGLKPDIIVVAKALGGMVPMAGVLAREKISSTFSPGTHGSTYAGNALSCQIALENLKQYENITLGDAMQTIGDEIKHLFTEHQLHIPDIIDVRGPGAMIGIEMASKNTADELVNHLFNAGTDLGLRITPDMLTSSNNMFNFNQLLDTPLAGISLKTTQQGRVLRITPPYLTNAQLNACLTMLDHALRKMKISK